MWGHQKFKVPFRAVPAVMLPVLVWLELITTVFRLPWTTTLRLLPIAVAPPMAVPLLDEPAPA
ncbi:hypothetical protein D1872_346040 [compost metagenome]